MNQSNDVTLRSIGNVLQGEWQRDAVHVAVLPCVAPVRVYPGQHVGPDCGQADCFGIVDPFLQKPVELGEKFWIFMYPATVEGLRHDWMHKHVDKENRQKLADVSVSKRAINIIDAKNRMCNFADEINITYDDLIRAAKEYQDNGTFLIGGNDYEGVYIYGGFWVDYKALTGNKVDDTNNFISCSC